MDEPLGRGHGQSFTCDRPSATMPGEPVRHDGLEPVKREKRVKPGMIADLTVSERNALRALAGDARLAGGAVFNSLTVIADAAMLPRLAAKGHLSRLGTYRIGNGKNYVQQYVLVAVSVARMWDYERMLEKPS